LNLKMQWMKEPRLNLHLNSWKHTKKLFRACLPIMGFLVISDGLEAKAGTISAGMSRFMAWKTSDGKTEASALTGQLEVLIQGMLNKETLLDLIRHFVVFEKSKKKTEKQELSR
jgi:type I site-specific restriction-modification system R (restriction) subunit